jgi:DNA-binding LacI/PurR family transcriptional regulator
MPSDIPPSLPRTSEPRYVALRRELRRVIAAGKPGDALPSYTRMIRSYGVGQATIDRVLREFDAAGLIVRKNGRGIFVSPRAAQKTIGLVFGRNIFGAGISPVCDMLLRRCEERARKHQENFKAYLDLPHAAASEDDVLPARRALVEDIEARKLDGLLLVWNHGAEEGAWLRAQKIPLVSMTSDYTRPSDYSVCLNYSELVREGVKALASQGCRRIGMLTPLAYLRGTGYDDDRKVFAAALNLAELEIRPEWIWEDRSGKSSNEGGNETHEEQGYRAFQELFGPARSGSPLPDGLVSLDDMLTRGALAAARKLKIEIGSELRIATHANKESPALQGCEQELVRLEIDINEMVEAMFGMLEPLMEGGAPTKKILHVKPRVLFPPA